MTDEQRRDLYALIDDIDQFGSGKFECVWSGGEIVHIYAGKSYKPIYTDLCVKQATIKDWKKPI